MELISTLKVIREKVRRRIGETVEAQLSILERALIPDSLESLVDLEAAADYPKPELDGALLPEVDAA